MANSRVLFAGPDIRRELAATDAAMTASRGRMDAADRAVSQDIAESARHRQDIEAGRRLMNRVRLAF